MMIQEMDKIQIPEVTSKMVKLAIEEVNFKERSYKKTDYRGVEVDGYDEYIECKIILKNGHEINALLFYTPDKNKYKEAIRNPNTGLFFERPEIKEFDEPARYEALQIAKEKVKEYLEICLIEYNNSINLLEIYQNSTQK